MHLTSAYKQTDLSQRNEGDSSRLHLVGLVLLLGARHEVEDGFHRSFEESVVILKLWQMLDKLRDQFDALSLHLEGLTVVDEL